ncbi:MAG: SRPBCC domain-containing protein, partial [Rhizobium leguminosarum]
MTASTQHELVLVREFDAPREKIYKAWTNPDLLKQWFVPRPWGVAEATLDVRPGGSSVVVMHDPEGNQYP